MTDITIEEVSAKLDTLLVQLTPKETPKVDARDTSLTKGALFLRKHLEGVLPKEKLDALSFDDLLLVAEMKTEIKQPTLNPAPTSKPDAKIDPRPAWLIPTIEGA